MIIDQLKGFRQPLVLADQRTCPPSPVFIHNLNQVSVFFLTLRLSCLPSGQPALAYPSPTYLVGLSTYVIKSFWTPFRSFYPPTNRFRFFFTKVFLLLPPLGLVTHFSLSSTLFTFLTCFSQLASVPVCVCSLCGLCCLWSPGELNGRVCDVVLLYYKPSAPYPGAGNQARVRRFSPRQARKPRERLCFRPLTPPLVPVVITDKPHGPFR